MRRTARYIEVFLGLFFLASAGMKALNVDGFGVAISAYGVIKDPDLLRIAAYATLGIETALGAAFVAGWRWKFASFLVSILLTTVFSGLIAYAWLVNGLEDCGCFGDYIKMTPPQSLAKNGVLIALIGFGWFGLRDSGDSEFAPGLGAKAIGLLGAAAVVGGGAYGSLQGGGGPEVVVSDDGGEKDFAYQISSGGSVIDLGAGEHLLVFLNTECEHCMASVPGLNAIDADEALPGMLALMLGDHDKLDDFVIETDPAFAMELFDDLTWAKHIKTAPPILYYIREGMEIESWEWSDDPPAPEVIAEAVSATLE